LTCCKRRTATSTALSASVSQLRHILIITYFAPDLQEALLKQTAVNVATFQYSETLLEQARQQQKVIRETDVAEPACPEPAEAVRDQGFRRAIADAASVHCLRTPLCLLWHSHVDG
jgi:hypothetical protein